MSECIFVWKIDVNANGEISNYINYINYIELYSKMTTRML